MDRLACIAQQVEDDSNKLKGEEEMNLQFPTASCRVSQSHWSSGEHCEHNLEESEEYFFVLVTPTDPESFVGFSPTRRVAPRPASPASLPVVSRPLVDGRDMTESQNDDLLVSSVPEPQSWRRDRQSSVLTSGSADQEYNTDTGDQRYDTGTKHEDDERMSSDGNGTALLEPGLASVQEQRLVANASPADVDASTSAPASSPAASLFSKGTS